MKDRFIPSVAVISAWRPELEALHSMMPRSVEVPLSKEQEHIRHFQGSVYGLNLVYLESGVGMTDAAISTSEILGKYPSVKYIVVAGVGGGLSPDIELAQVTVPDQWQDYSRVLLARPEGDGYQRPGHMGNFLHGENFGFMHPMKTKPVSVSAFMLEVARRNREDGKVDITDVIIGGSGLSASFFLDNPKYREFLLSIYPGSIVVDMESYAILRAAQRHIHRVEGIAIRTISDSAGKEGTKNNELEIGIQRATEQLTLFLDSYLYLFNKEI